jgi:hypothetical protein
MPKSPSAVRALRAIALCFAGCSAVSTGPAVAHHSFAMYDSAKQVTLAGVVKEFQWTNPHVWIQIMVPNTSGVQEEWGVECTSVNFMTRRGFSRRTLKPGDAISVTISPLKDGSHGGSFRNINNLNGAPLSLAAQD